MENQEYQNLLANITLLVKKSQTNALIQVNRELSFLYWNIGKKILEKQSEKGWGAKIIDNLAKDLSFNFPDNKGFSVRNLKNMQKFASAYPDFEIVQTVAAQLGWTHHILILDKFKDEKTRLWYMLKTIEQGWSYRVEYALRDVSKPIGVSSYQLTKQISENLKNNLPTEEELKTILDKININK